MEPIYLVIIIGYILQRVTRFLFKYRNVYRLLGYKRVFIAGNPVIIKKIDPIDFLEDSNGFPMTLFQFQKGKTLVDQLRKNGVDKEKLDEVIGLAKKIAEKAIVYMPESLKIDDFFDSKNAKAIQLGWGLYDQIIRYNFKALNKCYKMDRQYVVHVAELCVSFGKFPHEHIGTKRLSEIEKYIIDEFVFNAYVENENGKQKNG